MYLRVILPWPPYVMAASMGLLVFEHLWWRWHGIVAQRQEELLLDKRTRPLLMLGMIGYYLAGRFPIMKYYGLISTLGGVEELRSFKGECLQVSWCGDDQIFEPIVIGDLSLLHVFR